jgi:hypothetical protein
MTDSSFDDGVSSLTSLAPSIDPTERRKRTQQGSQTQAEVVKRTAASESPEPATPEANQAKRKRFPNLHRMALEILSISAMSAEVGRLFSQCKPIITDDRHSLEPDSIEALECVKSFYRQWLDHRQRGRPGQ